MVARTLVDAFTWGMNNTDSEIHKGGMSVGDLAHAAKVDVAMLHHGIKKRNNLFVKDSAAVTRNKFMVVNVALDKTSRKRPVLDN